MAQGQAIDRIPEDAGKEQATSQPVGSSQSPPVHITEASHQTCVRDTDKGDDRARLGLIVADSERIPEFGTE